MSRKPVAVANRPVIETQYFSSSPILQKVQPGTTQNFWVRVPEQKFVDAKRARLRFVVEGNPQGFSCRVNGTVIPGALSNSYTNDIEISPDILRENNIIAFHCANGSEGFQIDTASLILSHD
jgi:hypothetical protein